MKEWQKKREEELAELTLSTHVLAYLLLLIVFIIIDPIKEPSFMSYSAIAFSLLFPAAILIALDYHFLQKLENHTITAWNITKHAVLLAMITTVFSNIEGEYLWLFSALYLLPVVLSCITLGKTGGLAFAAAASGSIFLFAKNTFFSAENHGIEGVMVLSGIFFLMAWFLGKIMELQAQTTARLDSMIYEDNVTSLGNHRYFHEQLEQAVKKASKEHSPLSLIFLDIDYFKSYNKTYGYSQGDMLLQEIAESIKHNFPGEGVLARYNSDTFAIILPETDLQQAYTTAHHLKQILEQYKFPGEISLPYDKISISAGVANFPYHAQTPGELLDAADDALYNSKSTGRNRVRIYHAVLERLSRQAEENDRDLVNSLRTLMIVINGKDRYTYGHSERVSYYAKEVGKRVGLAPEKLRQLEFGAFLHDIGKLEIPPEVLNKKEPLSAEELEMLRQHPKWGAEIVNPISMLQPIIPMILYHHENFDGTGYPEGLKGKKIPLFARILRVVDSFDAMTTSRPYRRLLSREQAVEEILRYRNLYYDPLVTDIFIKIVKEEYGLDISSFSSSFSS